MLSGGFILLPLLIPLAVWGVMAMKRQRSALEAFAQAHGYIFQSNTVLNDLDGAIFQNPAYLLGQSSGPNRGYLMSWLIHGEIDGRQFRMYDYDLNKSNSDRSGNANFDTLDIAVKGEGLQFLLVSNTHQSALNKLNISLKRYQLEGDFSRYFTLYGAEGAEIEILRIFSPDTMAYLIDHYQNYSLELTPQHFFLYRASGFFGEGEANCESLITAATDLSTRFFSDVEKVQYAENAVVPASVQVQADRSRITGGMPLWAAVIGTVAVCVGGAGIGYLINSDNRVPAGYVRAADAKVSQDMVVPCFSYNNSCSTSYEVTADYTANGQPYRFHDSLVESHPVGSSINLYYDPTDPARADFVGGHSSKAALPIIASFVLFITLFIWIAYLSGKRRVRA